MVRRIFCQSFFAIRSLLIAGSFACTCSATEMERPNFVLIVADDVGYSDFGCYGSEIRTPHIDRLAERVMRFTQFYSNAVCVPTRASLYSGLYPRYAGKSHEIQLTPEMVTIAEILREAGYGTSLSGKWHLGREPPHHPLDRGFDEYCGLLDGCCNYFDPAWPDPPFEGGRVRFWAEGRRQITEFPENFYATDAITTHAIENIRRFAAAGKPFFANICYTAAHSPLHARPEEISRYHDTYAIGWDLLRHQRWRRQVELGLVDPRWRLPGREPEFPPWTQEPLTGWNENLMAVYAAMVSAMDQSVGRVLETLHDLGIEEHTVVIVLSDNGGCAEQAGGDDPTNVAGPKEQYVSCGAGWAYVQNTPFRRYKAWLHEGGISVPLVVRWPGVTPAGSVTGVVGHVLDLMPTILEIARADYPATRSGRAILPLEGRSLAPVLCGGKVHQPAALYWASRDNRAVRQGRWKLVWDQDVARWELYDMTADRTETNDLAGDLPDRVRQMTAAWAAWAVRTGAVQQLGTKYRLKPDLSRGLERQTRHRHPVPGKSGLQLGVYTYSDAFLWERLSQQAPVLGGGLPRLRWPIMRMLSGAVLAKKGSVDFQRDISVKPAE